MISDISELPPTAALALKDFDEQQSAVFDHEYQRKKRGTVAMVLLAILFPIQFFFLGKTGLGIAYWLTGGFFGLGWIVFWFVTPSKTRQYNEMLAETLVRNIELST